MGIKIRKRRSKGESKAQRRTKTNMGSDDIIEVGRGDFCVLTVNRHDGSTVVHRFETQAEANAQLERNVAADNPLVGCTEFN